MGHISYMCRTRVHKFFKNLGATSKLYAIKVQRCKNYTDEPKELGAPLTKLRWLDDWDLCSARVLVGGRLKKQFWSKMTHSPVSQAVISHDKTTGKPVCCSYCRQWQIYNFLVFFELCRLEFQLCNLFCELETIVFSVKYYIEVCLHLRKFSYFRPPNHPADSFAFIRDISIVFAFTHFHRNSPSSFLYLYLSVL
jgi:hypothetical protein